jgi:hypothetical protein
MSELKLEKEIHDHQTNTRRTTLPEAAQKEDCDIHEVCTSGPSSGRPPDVRGKWSGEWE